MKNMKLLAMAALSIATVGICAQNANATTKPTLNQLLSTTLQQQMPGATTALGNLQLSCTAGNAGGYVLNNVATADLYQSAYTYLSNNATKEALFTCTDNVQSPVLKWVFHAKIHGTDMVVDRRAVSVNYKLAFDQQLGGFEKVKFGA